MDKSCIDDSSSNMIDDTAGNDHRTDNTAAPQPIRFCTNCGAKFNGNEIFCTNCGWNRSGGMIQRSAPAASEKSAKNYGIHSLLLLISAYVVFFVSVFLPFEIAFLIRDLTVAMYIGALFLSVKTIITCKKHRGVAILTLCLVIIPMLLALASIIATISWFASHPDYEP